MRVVLVLIIVSVSLNLSACGILRNIESATQKLNKGISVVAEEHAKADADGNGKVSQDELLKWLFGLVLGGGGVVTARNAASARAKAAEKAETNARLAALEAKAAP